MFRFSATLLSLLFLHSAQVGRCPAVRSALFLHSASTPPVLEALDHGNARVFLSGFVSLPKLLCLLAWLLSLSHFCFISANRNSYNCWLKVKLKPDANVRFW